MITEDALKFLNTKLNLKIINNNRKMIISKNSDLFNVCILFEKPFKITLSKLEFLEIFHYFTITEE